MWFVEHEFPGPSVAKDTKGRTTLGWSANAVLPLDDESTDPLGGEYAWSDTPVKVSKA